MIKLEEIKKSFGARGNEQLVLKGISGEIKEGFTVILGASGSGKSTLLNIMSGLDRPTSGKVYYGNLELTSLTDKEMTKFRRDKVGFVYQQYYLLPHLSVSQNIKLGADLVDNKEWEPIAKALGLGDKLHKKPSQLSGGEQQRVCIARALAKKPEVLFLDEPTGALDENTGREVMDYIVKLKKQLNFTMVMVTHNVNIADMADEVLGMNSGLITSITHNPAPKSAYEIGW